MHISSRFILSYVFVAQFFSSVGAQPQPAVTEYGSSPTRVDSNATAAKSSDFSQYMSAVQSKVGQKAPQKFIGQVMITFKITKNGSVSDMRMVKSSGMPQIDDAAQAAIKTSAPFAELPTDAGQSVQIQIAFDGTSKGTNAHAIRIR